MIKRKNILKIAIDSPAAAGAGTLAKKISKHYNLFYLDTGKIYRYIAYIKIKNPKKFSYNLIKKKISNLKVQKIGLCLGGLVDLIPYVQAHDVALDYCITPHKVYRF